MLPDSYIFHTSDQVTFKTKITIQFLDGGQYITMVVLLCFAVSTLRTRAHIAFAIAMHLASIVFNGTGHT